MISTKTIKNIPLQLIPVETLPCNSNLKTRARALRQAYNLPEVLFWKQVAKGRFHDIDFDRQRIIGNYIVDFYIKRLGLVIEIDGSSHDGKEDYDRDREAYLVSLGLRVFRIQVKEIMFHMEEVMKGLEAYILEQYAQ